MRSEITHRHRPAMLAGMRGHAFRELASVKCRALCFRDTLKRSRVGGRGEFLARLRRPAVGHEVLGEAGTSFRLGACHAHRRAMVGDTR